MIVEVRLPQQWCEKTSRNEHLMLKFSIDFLSIRWNKRAYGSSLIRMVIHMRRLLRPTATPVSINFDQLRKINKLPISKSKLPIYNTRALFVVTDKDFGTLPTAIQYLMKSTGLQFNQIDIVTPEHHLNKCSEILHLNKMVGPVLLGEETILSVGDLVGLKAISGERFGWIYQQLLKVQVALNSHATFTLVCDADTLLLRSRNWIEGNFGLLLPSFEFNDDYYDFLSRAFNLSHDPEYSYVSHHMLINNEKIREIFKIHGLESIQNLAAVIQRSANFETASMVSVDYELYAQSMQKHFPHEVRLEKWSNIGVSARHFALFQKSWLFRKALQVNFQSVSFHSWS